MWKESEPQLWPHLKKKKKVCRKKKKGGVCRGWHSRRFGVSPERGSTSQKMVHVPEEQPALSRRNLLFRAFSLSWSPRTLKVGPFFIFYPSSQFQSSVLLTACNLCQGGSGLGKSAKEEVWCHSEESLADLKTRAIRTKWKEKKIKPKSKKTKQTKKSTHTHKNPNKTAITKNPLSLLKAVHCVSHGAHT